MANAPILHLLCQAYDRVQSLQSRARDLTPHERDDLHNLPAIIERLWERRRCEIRGASTNQPDSYAADRKGLQNLAHKTGETLRTPVKTYQDRYRERKRAGAVLVSVENE
jgi:hypothetical protein